MGHERRVHDPRADDLRVHDRLAPEHPALVERLRDPLPLVPHVCDQLVREVVGHVLQGALIGQRAA